MAPVGRSVMLFVDKGGVDYLIIMPAEVFLFVCYYFFLSLQPLKMTACCKSDVGRALKCLNDVMFCFLFVFVFSSPNKNVFLTWLLKPGLWRHSDLPCLRKTLIKSQCSGCEPVGRFQWTNPVSFLEQGIQKLCLKKNRVSAKTWTGIPFPKAGWVRLCRPAPGLLCSVFQLSTVGASGFSKVHL